MLLDYNSLVDGSKVDVFIIMEEGWTSLRHLEEEAGSDFVKKAQFVHYYPPHQQGSAIRSTPPLSQIISGAGGIREEVFQKRDICLLVDDAVFSGRTLGSAIRYASGLGYELEKVFVYARDIRHTDSGWNDGALSRDPCLRHISRYRDLMPGLIPER